MTDSVPQEELLDDEEAAEAAAADEGDEALSGDVGAADMAGASDAERDLAALNDRHLRLVAEFNNYRRRTEQERLGAWSRAQADVIEKFLDVLDDLARVAQLDLSNATVEAIMEGVDLVERKFVRMLEDTGVDVIDPTGERFDPERMEAMLRVPVDSEEQDEQVAQVFQKGYSLKGVLVRPARVSVYKRG
jgi:molecular chaperone GrpE